jgi:hypothetical protein
MAYGSAIAPVAAGRRKREPGGEGPKAAPGSPSNHTSTSLRAGRGKSKISPTQASVAPVGGGHASKMAGNRAKFGAAVAKSKPSGSMVSSAPAAKTEKVAG